MEVWTFINKETNEIIRCDIKNYDSEFYEIYYLTTGAHSPLWFVKTKEKAEFAYKKDVHPQYSINYTTPDTDGINLEDYKIVNFELN
jgi:hypothetical protein